MEIYTFPTSEKMAHAAAKMASEMLIDAINRSGQAAFIAATGASQFEFLEILTSNDAIDWGKTTMFHLDEYIGLPATHPASFRRYLNERIVNLVNPGTVHLISGNTDDPFEECERLNQIISDQEIDVAFVGIGENGHLAFNDPPADFDVEDPFIVVDLDKECRMQQLGEGWFTSLEEVPRQAITMSIRQILESKKIICSVPDGRKAQAVHDCFTGEISPLYPASILQKHENAYVYLDADAASLLENKPLDIIR